MALFCTTIFLSAFLLFQVQPLIGKVILPWFGGSPAVWLTCMLFFGKRPTLSPCAALPAAPQPAAMAA